MTEITIQLEKHYQSKGFRSQAREAGKILDADPATPDNETKVNGFPPTTCGDLRFLLRLNYKGQVASRGETEEPPNKVGGLNRIRKKRNLIDPATCLALSGKPEMAGLNINEEENRKT
jgi:hypothetical protein